jgi:hypothetical protein
LYSAVQVEGTCTVHFRRNDRQTRFTIKGIKRSNQLIKSEPDQTPISHDITEDPISVPEEPDESQLPFDPLQEQAGCTLEECTHLLPSGRPPGTTTRSGRAFIPPELFMEQVCAVLDDSDAVEDCGLQREVEDPIAFAASGSDPDTLHYNAAMKAHDSEDFKVAMIKEANDHTTRSHWALW